MNCCCSGGRDGVTDVSMGNPADTLSGALVITVAPIGGFIRTGAPIKCHFKVKNINVNIYLVYSQILKKKWRWKKTRMMKRCNLFIPNLEEICDGKIVWNFNEHILPTTLHSAAFTRVRDRCIWQGEHSLLSHSQLLCDLLEFLLLL